MATHSNHTHRSRKPSKKRAQVDRRPAIRRAAKRAGITGHAPAEPARRDKVAEAAVLTRNHSVVNWNEGGGFASLGELLHAAFNPFVDFGRLPFSEIVLEGLARDLNTLRSAVIAGDSGLSRHELISAVYALQSRAQLGLELARRYREAEREAR